MAKARKTVRKTASGSRKTASARGKTAASTKKAAAGKAAGGAKKAAGGKKKGTARGGKRGAAKPPGLDLSSLKKQIREHAKKLSTARTRSSDPRVSDALASLERVYSELESSCGSTMVIPLD